MGDAERLYPVRKASLSNLMARETSAASMQPYQWVRSDIPQDDEARQGEKLAPRVTPTAKNAGFSVDSNPRTDQLRHGQNDPIFTYISSGLRNILPTSPRVSKKSEATLPKKRKGSLPNVDLGRMTTVQEAALDSPTIPGRPPILERSLSVPGFALRRVSEDLNESMPSTAELSKSGLGSSLSSVMSHNDGDTNSSKRSLSTRNLPPLIIPSKTKLPQTLEANFPSPTHDVAVLPPQVPPKSPRTESRASPRKGPHPLAGNHALTQCTTFSPVVPSNGMASRAPPRPPRTPMTGESPPDILFPNSVDSKSPESFRTGIERLQSPLGLARPKFPTGINSEPNSSSATSPSNLQSHHQRWVSETSVTTRGRHERNYSTSIYRSLSKSTMRNQPSHARNHELPSGFKVDDIMNKMSKKELKNLKQQAGLQVGNYEVLQSHDVRSLSKELRLLDERCEYLRRTYESLRHGRKSLHDRMISYLKTPSLASFSRETVLNQEESLAELDNSIDDWVKKLEQAENRRTRIRQKLLEHVAAALTLEFPSNPLTHQVTNQQTPPESPTRCDDYYPNERREVQSIKIYADSGVAALLAEIEQEIDFMDENSKF